MMEAVSTRPPRWNHNLPYHRVILAAVPDGARRSLDVGCGVGMLALGSPIPILRADATAASSTTRSISSERSNMW